MNKKELKKFEDLLKQQLALLTQNISHLQEVALTQTRADASGDLSKMPMHSADISSDIVSQDLTLGLMESEQGVIKDINQALQKIKDGTFGFCEHCGEAISINRLEYIPYTKMCISCKTKEESMRKRF